MKRIVTAVAAGLVGAVIGFAVCKLQPSSSTPDVFIAEYKARCLEREDIIVNFSGTTGTRFLRLCVALLLSEKDVKEQLVSTGVMTEIDRAIGLGTGGVSFSDYSDHGPGNLRPLRDNIKNEINRVLQKKQLSGRVVDVLIDAYFVQ